MKITVVPAQVTTVEDRIIGNLGFSQMLLLITPVFISAALFALLPPFMESAVYKYLIMGTVVFVCSMLAIRLKGRIVALWLVTILRYNLRPKYYLFNKNVLTLRQEYPAIPEDEESGEVTTKNRGDTLLPRLTIPEAAKVFATIENPAARVHFETTKKGGLNVRFTQIEE